MSYSIVRLDISTLARFLPVISGLTLSVQKVTQAPGLWLSVSFNTCDIRSEEEDSKVSYRLTLVGGGVGLCMWGRSRPVFVYRQCVQEGGGEVNKGRNRWAALLDLLKVEDLQGHSRPWVRRAILDLLCLEGPHS